MRVRVGVAVMSALLVLYLGVAIRSGVILLATGEPVPVALGGALLVLPVLGAAGLAAEIVFAWRAERLARRLERTGGLPAEELPLRPSGRVDREAADAAFPAYRRAVEEAPGEWEPWFRLALAYDACGDRRRARWATRRAISLERASR